MIEQERTRILERLASDAIPDDIDVWRVVHARVTTRKKSTDRLRARWVMASAATVVVLALSFLGGLTWWSGTESVSAQTILDRAETMATTPTTITTYHLVMTRRTPGKDPNETISSEVWFGGPDRQRALQRTTDQHGTLVQSQDVIFNGPETWIVVNQNGQTRAIHTTGTEWTRPADDPLPSASLSQLISSYTDKQCAAAHLRSASGTVAGQTTYIIDVASRVSGCGPSAVASPEPVRVSGQVQGNSPFAGQTTVWVDKQTFLPLKTEQRDAAGTLLDVSEVTSIDYNAPIPDSTFMFVPPAGMHVATFTGGSGADVKRALADAAGGPPPP